jgi:hypothetical protein
MILCFYFMVYDDSRGTCEYKNSAKMLKLLQKVFMISTISLYVSLMRTDFAH